MTRPYPFRPKSWSPLAAGLALTVALAGCGASGGGSAPSAPSPTHAGGTAATGGGVSGPKGAQQGGGRASGSGGGAVFVPVVQSLGQVSAGSMQLSHGGGQLTHSGLPGTLSGSVGQLTAAGDSPSPPASSGGSQPSSPGASRSAGSSGSGRTGSPTKTRTVVKVVTKYQTVVRTVAPEIPAGAVLPSSHVVSIQRFAVGSNIVCYVAAGGASCEINHHSWLPSTPKPTSCHHSWGRALEVVGTKATRFLCTDKTLFWGHPPQIARGYDDVIGATRCEVRQFGVNCFVFQHHGFLISRSGYLRY